MPAGCSNMKNYSSSSYSLLPRKKHHHRVCSYAVAVFLVVSVVVICGEDFRNGFRRTLQRQDQWRRPPRLESLQHQTQKVLEVDPLPFAVVDETSKSTKDDCGIFNGKWVYDETTPPLYDEGECPYIQPQLTCQKHGRPDRGYQYWRWQPHHCSLPRFDAAFMLEQLRGKRMLFIGDSLNRGQFVSMVCLLQSKIPKASKSMETFDSLTVFTAKDYSATIEFYWAPFLVESNSDDAVVHRITDRIVRGNSIEKHAKHWKGADIFVFNTYLWWMTGKKMKILKGSFSDEKKEIVKMKTEDSYRMAMKSMIKWTEKHVDSRKKRIFFTSMSPSHSSSNEWGGEKDGNCYNQTTPIEEPSYWGSSSKTIMQVIGEEFGKAKLPIEFINITQLSEYRKDAHTSIYKKQWNPLTPEQLANPKTYADCIHWCLPGLQDTWNQLFRQCSEQIFELAGVGVVAIVYTGQLVDQYYAPRVLASSTSYINMVSKIFIFCSLSSSDIL